MIQITFTILTQKPYTPNTFTVKAPDIFLGLKNLAFLLNSTINWNGHVHFPGEEDASPEIHCQLCNGGICYDARVFVAWQDATLDALAAKIKQAGVSLRDAQTAPAESGPASPGPTPDPVVIPDPDKPGAVRVAASWGED